MALQVQDQTREQTSACMFSFQCLEEATRNVCTISPYLVEEVYFLHTPPQTISVLIKKDRQFQLYLPVPDKKRAVQTLPDISLKQLVLPILKR